MDHAGQPVPCSSPGGSAPSVREIGWAALPLARPTYRIGMTMRTSADAERAAQCVITLIGPL